MLPLTTAADSYDTRFGELDLFAGFPCPLKVPMETELARLLADQQQQGITLQTTLDACDQLSLVDQADSIEQLDDLPDLIFSGGLNGFLSRPFRQRFLDTGLFHRWEDTPVHPRLTSLGLTDPTGFFKVIAINLYVLAVDRSRIGDLPLPRRWADLLDPCYGGTTAICAHGGSFNESALLSLHALFGDDGLRALGRTIGYGLHPSQFVKHLGLGKPDTPAIAMLPLFFAKTAKNQEDLAIIWPEEGALATPLFMLAKESEHARLQPLIDFFTSTKVANICSGAMFPALHPEARQAIPDDAPLSWPGWPFLLEHDLAALRHATQQTFVDAWTTAHPDKQIP